MAHRRFAGRGRGVSDSQRRKKQWTGFKFASDLINGLVLPIPDSTGSNTAQLVLAQFALDDTPFQESTLLRLRGSVLVPKSTLSSALIHTIAFGIGVVTNESAEVAAVPNPATAEGASWDGWLFYRANLAGSLDANATVFDAKSMRKIGSGMSLVFVAGQSQDLGAGASNTEISIIARGLFLLS